MYRMVKNQNKENLFARQGCKYTKSRKAMIGLLEKAETPLSAEEIFIQLKEAGVTANLSTVYRNLDLMESLGFVSKTIMNDGKARFEITGEEHKHHLICTNCHKMISIDFCPLESIEKDIFQKTQFDITGHKLEIYGLCPECRRG